MAAGCTNGYFTYLCRFCANEQPGIEIYSDLGREKRLHFKIKLCKLPFKVTREDTLPTFICYTCIWKLNAFHDFFFTSTNVQQRLRNLIPLYSRVLKERFAAREELVSGNSTPMYRLPPEMSLQMRPAKVEIVNTRFDAREELVSGNSTPMYSPTPEMSLQMHPAKVDIVNKFLQDVEKVQDVSEPGSSSSNLRLPSPPPRFLVSQNLKKETQCSTGIKGFLQEVEKVQDLSGPGSSSSNLRLPSPPPRFLVPQNLKKETQCSTGIKVSDGASPVKRARQGPTDESDVIDLSQDKDDDIVPLISPKRHQLNSDSLKTTPVKISKTATTFEESMKYAERIKSDVAVSVEVLSVNALPPQQPVDLQKANHCKVLSKENTRQIGSCSLILTSSSKRVHPVKKPDTQLQRAPAVIDITGPDPQKGYLTIDITDPDETVEFIDNSNQRPNEGIQISSAVSLSKIMVPRTQLPKSPR